MTDVQERRPTADDGHNDHVAQPHSSAREGPIAQAEVVAAAISTDQDPLGRPGRPLNRRSPFFVGMLGAAGVATTYLIAELIITAQSMLVLIGLAFFIAVGLEPAVSWLVNHRIPRWAAVVAVVLGTLGVAGGFLAVAIPLLVTQASMFFQHLPQYIHTLQDHNSLLGRLNDRFQLQQHIQQLLGGQSGGADVLTGVVGAGVAVLSTVGNLLVVAALTVYFVADLPRIRRTLYRLVPHSRRPRVILIGDEIFAKVGAYVLGNVIISLIAGTAAYVWLLIVGVPYALLLAILVAVLDLVPIVGSTIAGIGVSLVALTVSLPVAIGTGVFFVVYQSAENYLLVPRIIGRAMKVPDIVTVVAALLGGVLLGIVGALVAIPAAAAVLLILREVTFPRLDRT
ncbi:MAG TPA: AI-2E family transporter [Pseudonocardiaceae bacterium]|jgi:predicted PurR-regulated permease PerM|nr:AI-2E family transporter [Pseudonocardiaceae bacterium]